MMRKSTIAFALIALAAAALAAELAHGIWRTGTDAPALARMERMTAALGLTDPALFTEARYTRHLSQADLFTPFQDAPLSFEHFPSGSLLVPPRHFGPAGGFAPGAGRGNGPSGREEGGQ